MLPEYELPASRLPVSPGAMFTPVPLLVKTFSSAASFVPSRLLPIVLPLLWTLTPPPSKPLISRPSIVLPPEPAPSTNPSAPRPAALPSSWIDAPAGSLVPSITTGSVISGSPGLAGLIVCVPLPGMLNVIVSGVVPLAWELAKLIAARSEPTPVSFVFVTARFDPVTAVDSFAPPQPSTTGSVPGASPE